MSRISDQEIADLEHRIKTGMTTAEDLELFKRIVAQIEADVRGRSEDEPFHFVGQELVRGKHGAI